MPTGFIHRPLEYGPTKKADQAKERLNAQAAAKVATALTRLAAGNFSNVKGVGSGLFEYRIDFGPGYRIYFGKDNDGINA